MGLARLFNTHFNPFEKTKQIQEDTPLSNALGIGGLSLMGTALIGYKYFGARAQTAALLAIGGAGFFASYLSGKDGYAWVIGALGSSGMAYRTVEAVNSGRLWVNVRFDIAEIIRAVRETRPPQQPTPYSFRT